MDGSASMRRNRHFRPAVSGLESRTLAVTAVSALFVTPQVLTPPNNRFVKVTVYGHVIDSSPKYTPTAIFQVVDEYARFQPGGAVKLTKQTPTVYDFRFTIVLQARRAQSDFGGRQYNVIVGAMDSQNGSGKAVSVLVPHSIIAPGPAVATAAVGQKRV